MILTPGKYRGALTNAGIMAGKNGDERVFMEFTTDQGMITWFGYLTEKSKAITVKALLAVGYNGSDWNALSNGMKSFTPRDVNLTIIEDTHEGKTRLKVQWVNEIHESKFETMAASQVKSSDRGLFTQIRAEAGMPKAKQNTSDEIPF